MAKRTHQLPLESERDGRALAVKLLKELDAAGADERWSLDPQCPPVGPAQDTPFLRYLEILRERNSPEVERGFCAVLTDFIALALGGSVASPGFFEQFVDATSRRRCGALCRVRRRLERAVGVDRDGAGCRAGVQARDRHPQSGTLCRDRRLLRAPHPVGSAQPGRSGVARMQSAPRRARARLPQFRDMIERARERPRRAQQVRSEKPQRLMVRSSTGEVGFDPKAS
jgi:hypothetical protein